MLVLNGRPLPRERRRPIRRAGQRQQPVPGGRRRRRPMIAGEAKAGRSAATRPTARRCPAGAASSCSTRSTIRAPTISARSRVPAGHVFLMGDNRDDSLDSRFARGRRRDRLRAGRESRRPGAVHLLVDRRQRRIGCPGPGSARCAGTGSARHYQAMSDFAGFAARRRSATSRATCACSSARSPIPASARTATSGSNSSATGCSAWSSRAGSTSASRTSPKASCRGASMPWSSRETCAEVGRELGVAGADPARQAGARGRRAATATMSSATSSRR